jgi:hypothetical protein
VVRIVSRRYAMAFESGRTMKTARRQRDPLSLKIICNPTIRIAVRDSKECVQFGAAIYAGEVAVARLLRCLSIDPMGMDASGNSRKTY